MGITIFWTLTVIFCTVHWFSPKDLVYKTTLPRELGHLPKLCPLGTETSPVTLFPQFTLHPLPSHLFNLLKQDPDTAARNTCSHCYFMKETTFCRRYLLSNSLSKKYSNSKSTWQWTVKKCYLMFGQKIPLPPCALLFYFFFNIKPFFIFKWTRLLPQIKQKHSSHNYKLMSLKQELGKEAFKW